MNLIHAIEFLTYYVVGTSLTEDFVYSLLSLWHTGVIMEDSLFFDCATMGNKSC